ncbi:unnamed protein product [Laminaria digitata]
MELASELCLSVLEKRVALSELHCADEVFTAGTMGEVTLVLRYIGVHQNI